MHFVPLILSSSRRILIQLKRERPNTSLGIALNSEKILFSLSRTLVPLPVSLPSVLVPDIESILHQQQDSKYEPDDVADT